MSGKGPEPPKHGRARWGDRPKCSQFKNDGTPCNAPARRNSEPRACSAHGGWGRGEAASGPRDAVPGAKQRKARIVQVSARVDDFIAGRITVEELDDEELARGYPRSANGRFAVPPKVVPRALHTRMIRELFKRADVMLKKSLVDCVETLTEIATNPEAEHKDRIKASIFVLERVMGKTPEVVHVGVEEKPYQNILNKIDRDMESDSFVIEGEVGDGSN